jgi:cell wall-associated NlpC family hydrolase
MRMHRPSRSFLAGVALVAVAATGAGVATSGTPAAAQGAAHIAPVPSPLPVPPVLEMAARRLERAQAAQARTAQRAARTAAKERTKTRAKPSTQTVDPTAIGERASKSTGADEALVTADVLDNGIALPPFDAPSEVRAIIESGNAIARTPYKWGGGHGKWQDTGYDCSGSVSFALAAAGLLSGPLASGPLMSWGKAGKGRWVTIYANPGHVYLEVAGIRFDTSAQRVTGSRWINEMRSTAGFVARHPAGL